MKKTGIIILSDIHYINDASKCKLSLKDSTFLTQFLCFIKKSMTDENIRYKERIWR